jgi:DNA polymerase I-like protein with 3'-5' exonuclease and polymerase domains
MLYFDIETDGFIEDLTKIHCLCIRDDETEGVYRFNTDIEPGLDMLMQADKIAGHNVIKFDIPAIQKLYPHFKVTEQQVIDTLTLSTLIYPDLSEVDMKLLAKEKLDKKLFKSHALKAWGQRMGFLKGDYDMSVEDNRLSWSQEMEDYCVQDCLVTEKLYKHLMSKNPSKESVELEHQLQWITADMETQGFYFDKEKAADLHTKLIARKLDLAAELQKAFPPWEVKAPPVISKSTNSKTGRVKGQPYVKVTITEFNPNSRMHIADRLKTIHGWEPKEFTPSGQAKVDDSVIAKLDYPEAKLLAEYLVIDKRLGQLSDGNQAWLKKVNTNDSKIHGSIRNNGAVTGRATHSHPNLAQVPSSSAPFGSECRGLFSVPVGKSLVGADLSGLELRCLAHYMGQYDSGAYAKQLLEGDIHTTNQHAAGLNDRAQAKRFIYAFLYGAGAEKIGEVVGGSKKEGAMLKKRFLAKTPALKKLITNVTAYAEKHGYVPGLDGRLLKIRSPHAALNTLLQSAGALISKQAIILFKQLLTDKGYQDRAHLVAWVHDEIQVESDKEIADEVGKLAVQSFEISGKHFQFRCPITGEYKVGSNWSETH